MKRNVLRCPVLPAAGLALALLGCGGREEPAAPQEPAAREAPAAQGGDVQVFRAEREQFDENGWKARIAVSVQGDDVVDVEYEEVNAQGALKRNDQEYARRMQEASGLTPVEAVTRLSEQLEQADDPEEVDAVSGATGTSETFLDLAREALSNR